MAYIKGLDEVHKKIALLGVPKPVKNAANRAIRKAMRIVVQQARENAKRIDDPETREAIYKNIVYKQGRSKSINIAIGRVGVQGGASSNKSSKQIVFKERRKKGEGKQALASNQVALPGGNTRHFMYVEFGTSNMPPTPFLRPALSNNIQQITDSFAATFSAELDKELAKL